MPAVSESSTPTEVIVGAVLGSLVVAACLGVAVFFVQRFYARQSQIQATRSAYRQRQQRSLTSETTSDSRHSSHSRVSARSRPSNSSTRVGASAGFTLTATEIDLEANIPSAVNQGAATPTNGSQEPIAMQGAFQQDATTDLTVSPITALRALEVSYDYRSDRTPDSGVHTQPNSKPSSRQRTPVSAQRKSRRRSSCGLSTTSRTSSGDRQTATVSTNSSSHGRRRSRSRSSLKLKSLNDKLFVPPTDRRRAPAHRSNSTHNSAAERPPPPRYQLRKSKSSGRTNEAFDTDFDIVAPRPPIYSPATRRQGYKKSLSAEQPGGATGDRKKPRRPRQQRRKTTQCVFSPRDQMQAPMPFDADTSVAYNPDILRRDKIKHSSSANVLHPGSSTDIGQLSPATLAKCLDRDTVTSAQCQQQMSACPLQCLSNRKYETSTCPLQTPNCSKDDIKESDLPSPSLIINPRDSDLSFTVDLNDIDVNDSLSVFCAPRVDLMMTSNGGALGAAEAAANETPPDTPTTPTPGTPVMLTPTPSRSVSAQPQCTATATSRYSSEPTSAGSASVYSDHASFLPQKPVAPSIYNDRLRHYRQAGNGIAVPTQQKQHYNGYAGPSAVIEQRFAAAVPVVEHLEQLPLMVPVFKLSTRDYDVMQRASGSWRSFSSDTSLDSMSSPV